MLGIPCQSLLSCHAPHIKQASPPLPRTNIFPTTWRMVLSNSSLDSIPFCPRLHARSKSSTSLWSSLRVPYLQNSGPTELYLLRPGPSRPAVAMATDGDGDNSERESNLKPSGRESAVGVVKRAQTAVQIFVAALLYVVYFFGASAWDGKGKRQ